MERLSLLNGIQANPHFPQNEVSKELETLKNQLKDLQLLCDSMMILLARKGILNQKELATVMSELSSSPFSPPPPPPPSSSPSPGMVSTLPFAFPKTQGAVSFSAPGGFIPFSSSRDTPKLLGPLPSMTFTPKVVTGKPIVAMGLSKIELKTISTPLSEKGKSVVQILKDAFKNCHGGLGEAKAILETKLEEFLSSGELATGILSLYNMLRDSKGNSPFPEHISERAKQLCAKHGPAELERGEPNIAGPEEVSITGINLAKSLVRSSSPEPTPRGSKRKERESDEASSTPTEKPFQQIVDEGSCLLNLLLDPFCNPAPISSLNQRRGECLFQGSHPGGNDWHPGHRPQNPPCRSASIADEP